MSYYICQMTLHLGTLRLIYRSFKSLKPKNNDVNKNNISVHEAEILTLWVLLSIHRLVLSLKLDAVLGLFVPFYYLGKFVLIGVLFLAPFRTGVPLYIFNHILLPLLSILHMLFTDFYTVRVRPIVKDISMLFEEGGFVAFPLILLDCVFPGLYFSLPETHEERVYLEKYASYDDNSRVEKFHSSSLVALERSSKRYLELRLKRIEQFRHSQSQMPSSYLNSFTTSATDLTEERSHVLDQDIISSGERILARREPSTQEKATLGKEIDTAHDQSQQQQKSEGNSREKEVKDNNSEEPIVYESENIDGSFYGEENQSQEQKSEDYIGEEEDNNNNAENSVLYESENIDDASYGENESLTDVDSMNAVCSAPLADDCYNIITSPVPVEINSGALQTPIKQSIKGRATYDYKEEYSGAEYVGDERDSQDPDYEEESYPIVQRPTGRRSKVLVVASDSEDENGLSESLGENENDWMALVINSDNDDDDGDSLMALTTTPDTNKTRRSRRRISDGNAQSRVQASGLRLRQFSKAHDKVSLLKESLDFTPRRPNNIMITSDDENTVASVLTGVRTEAGVRVRKRESFGERLRATITGDHNIRIRDYLFDVEMPLISSANSVVSSKTLRSNASKVVQTQTRKFVSRDAATLPPMQNFGNYEDKYNSVRESREEEQKISSMQISVPLRRSKRLQHK